MNKQQQKRLIQAALLAVITFIFLLTLLPAPLIRPVRKYIHIKTGHRLAYAVLSLVLLAFLRTAASIKPVLAYIYTLVLATVFGAFLEACQYISTTREGDVNDIIINLTGALAGTALALVTEYIICFVNNIKIKKN